MSVTQSTRFLLARRLAKCPRTISQRLSEASRATTAFVSASLTAPASSCERHSFHTSRACQARRKRFSSVQAEKMGLVTPEKTEKFAQSYFPRYRPDEYQALEEVYTPEQIKAIEAGEEAIDPKDLAIQGRWRTDMYRFPYWEDFSNYQPSVDKFPEPTDTADTDPKSRWMTQEELNDDFIKFLEKRMSKETKEAIEAGMPLEEAVEDVIPNAMDFHEWSESSKFTGGFEPEKPSRSAMAPALPPKVPGVAGLYEIEDEEVEGDDEADQKQPGGMSPEQVAMEKRGWTQKMLKSVQIRMIESKRVTNQTRLGKVHNTRYTVIAGNGDGWLGMGMAKGNDDTVTPLKAKALAILNMRPIRRYEDRTIYGNVKAKFGGTQVELYARPPGFGLRVPNNVFHICRFAGLKDLAARMPRAANKMNTVKATVQALHNQKDPEEIAKGRGKKLVDVRKVYYGGLVY